MPFRRALPKAAGRMSATLSAESVRCLNSVSLSKKHNITRNKDSSSNCRL